MTDAFKRTAESVGGASSPPDPPEPRMPAQPVTIATRDAQRLSVELLLQAESEARRAATVGELRFAIANDAMKLTRARQVFVFSCASRRSRVEQVSSIGRIDRDAPRIRWIEAVLGNLANDAGLDQAREFVLPAYCPKDDTEHETFPFRFMLWMPFHARSGETFAGMLLVREVPWNAQDQTIAARLAETYAHAWSALGGRSHAARRLRPKWLALGLTAAAIAAGFVPVPLTVVAPAEVTSVDPRVVAAPMDGVVEDILVAPNQSVAAGQLLLSLSTTTLRNELLIAEQNVAVAEARLKQISQGAVSDAGMRAELAVAGSELALAEAKRDYARDMLTRTAVIAPIPGVAVFGDPRDWTGRPVSTGERIMEIADPGKLELRIDLPVADAIALRHGAKVRAFLDTSPLSPLDATVRSTSFEAQLVENNTLAFRIYASLADQTQGTRLGTRGTAQVYGETVPLAFYVFRRPVAAMRQWLGL